MLAFGDEFFQFRKSAHITDGWVLFLHRHLGNDIVIVIFKEGNTPFDPTGIPFVFCLFRCCLSIFARLMRLLG